MTAIVGILCKDGIVIGADGSTTFTSGSEHTIEQPTEKIHIIADQIIVAGSGSVGYNQRFCDIVTKQAMENLFKNDYISIGKYLCRAFIEDLSSTYTKTGNYTSLLAFYSENEFYLCEFALTGFQPEYKTKRIWYCSIGSGQKITDPFLGFMRGIFWSEGQPSLNDGIFVVTWTLKHAIEVNPGGINEPIQIAVLNRNEGNGPQAKILSKGELGQHYENIENAKSYLKKYINEHNPELANKSIKTPKFNSMTK